MKHSIEEECVWDRKAEKEYGRGMMMNNAKSEERGLLYGKVYFQKWGVIQGIIERNELKGGLDTMTQGKLKNRKGLGCMLTSKCLPKDRKKERIVRGQLTD